MVRTMRPPPFHEVVETARIAALDSFAILDTPPDPQMNALADAAAAAAVMPMAQISLLDRTRQWIKAASGPRPPSVPRHLAFCQSTLDVPAGLLWIQDAQADPRFQHHPWVAGSPQIRSYAGAALIDHDGYRLGTIAVQDLVARPLDRKVMERLERLAVEVIALLERDRAARDDERAARDAAGDFRTTVNGRWLAGPAMLAGGEHPPGTPSPGLDVKALQDVPVQGWLGVRTGPASGSAAGEPAGVPVLSVAHGSPAEQAGIGIGDVLLTIDHRPIRRSADIQASLADRPSGSTAALSLRRAGALLEAHILIEPLPAARAARRRSDQARR